MNKDLLREWKALAAEVRKHNKLYEKGQPLVDDDYYDAMTQRLAWIEGIIGPQRNSPLYEVRASEGVMKVPHLVPMLSLDHGFLKESISAFLKRLGNLLLRPSTPQACSPSARSTKKGEGVVSTEDVADDSEVSDDEMRAGVRFCSPCSSSSFCSPCPTSTSCSLYSSSTSCSLHSSSTLLPLRSSNFQFGRASRAYSSLDFQFGCSSSFYPFIPLAGCSCRTCWLLDRCGLASCCRLTSLGFPPLTEGAHENGKDSVAIHHPLAAERDAVDDGVASMYPLVAERHIPDNGVAEIYPLVAERHIPDNGVAEIYPLVGERHIPDNGVAEIYPLVGERHIPDNGVAEIYPLVAEHKVDGVALALRYVDGKLVMALTRGNGALGVDVTAQIRHLDVPRELRIRCKSSDATSGALTPLGCSSISEFLESSRFKLASVEASDSRAISDTSQRSDSTPPPAPAHPQESPSSSESIVPPVEPPLPSIVEVRGELFMKFADFEPIKDRFSSPRNACAAFVQNKNPISYMKASFFPHSVVGVEGDSYVDLMNSLEGFEQFPRVLCNSEQECLDFFTETEMNRGSIPYPIDGVVFKVNRMSDWPKFGFHTTGPRYAFAAKFTPLFKKTTIREIHMQVGKFGTITPVAIFDAIEIDGSNIRRASIHNVEELKKHRYGVGDEILVSRAGDTVPYISEKVYDAGNPASVNACPSCGRGLIPFEQTLKCPGSWDCPEQKADRFEHFCSRNAFNIQGMGKKVVRSFIEKSFVEYPCDIFELHKYRKQILNLEGWSEKSVGNLMSAIDERRKIGLANFIFALCIPNVGYGNAITLAKAFPIVDAFFANFSGEVQEVRGIGAVTIKAIQDFINGEDKSWLQKLIACVEIV